MSVRHKKEVMIYVDVLYFLVMFQESVGDLPDEGLVVVDVSSVEECEFLCLLVVPMSYLQVHVGLYVHKVWRVLGLILTCIL